MSNVSIIVVGAGAAGLMAAAEAAIHGARVTLLEKNSKTGVKILMSGGTRCNLTQDTDAKGIVSAFGRGGRFLQKSVGAFPPSEVVKLFHQLQVATKVESTGKIFPQSNRAVQVRDALHRRAIEAGVQLRLKCPVKSMTRLDSGFEVATDRGPLQCDRLIVTAGGKSWPGCGTTGDAYAWLQRLGHTIVRPRPALVPLVGGFDWTHDLSGLTLDDCVASVFRKTDRKRKAVVCRRSGWLFTHFGFSGPAAMDVSGAMTAAESFNEVTLAVDLIPDLTNDQLGKHLSERVDGGRRRVESIVAQWLPNRLAEAIVKAHDADTTIAELPRRQALQLVEGLKGAQFPIHGTRGFAKAEVTAGGVKLSEVDSRTLESRLVPGLFIAGEVLDVDGWIGGYNFQAAFSTGRAAGIAASQPRQ